MNGRKKLVVVAVFTGLWFVVVLMRSRFGGGATQTSIDASWWLGLVAMFKQGSISGRDFQFTYGLLGQTVAGLATRITTSHSVFDSLSISFLFIQWLAAIAISASIMVAKRISAGKAAFIYVSIGILNILLEPGSFRLSFLILCCVVAHRCAEQTSSRRRLYWAVMTGITCFVAQLATPEVGIFGVATAICLMGLQAYRTRDLSNALKTAIAIAATFVVANFIISVAFSLSSPTYQSLFAYQSNALETMRGYQNGMGLSWRMDAWHTFALAAVACFTLICAAQTFRKVEFGEASLFISLAIGSLFSLRSALVRSDVDHIAYALTPMVFTFLVFVPSVLRLKKRPAAVAVWGVFYIVLLAAWPRTGLAALNDLRTWATQVAPASTVWRQIRNQHTAPEELLPRQLVAESAQRQGVPMLAFPYDDFIPVLLRRPLVAPVLQNYSAGTVQLQDYYVRELARYKEKGMEVLYAEDGVAAVPIDGVEAITRTPAVFEYLYRNYRQRAYDGDEMGLLLLQPTHTVRDSKSEKLPFAKMPENRNTGTIVLPSPSSCGLVRMELEIDYPFAKVLLRPNPLVFEVRLRGALVKTFSLSPTAIGSPFTTLFSTIPSHDFHDLFGSGLVFSRSWDSIRYHVPHTDKLSVNPSNVDILKVECVDAVRFIPLESSNEAAQQTFHGLPETEGHSVTGFIKLVPDASNAPRLTARLAYFSSVSEVSEATLSRDASVDLDAIGKDTPGFALVNPGTQNITIELSTVDSLSHTLQQTQIQLAPGHQVSRFIKELLDMTSEVSRLRVRSEAPFGLLVVDIRQQSVQILPITNLAPVEPSTVFPQFAMYGNWATEVILANPSNETITGTVQLRSATNSPLSVTLNGVTASEFRYTIPPGGSFKLSPQ